jgi:hypothetical protein
VPIAIASLPSLANPVALSLQAVISLISIVLGFMFAGVVVVQVAVCGQFTVKVSPHSLTALVKPHIAKAENVGLIYGA